MTTDTPQIDLVQLAYQIARAIRRAFVNLDTPDTPPHLWHIREQAQTHYILHPAVTTLLRDFWPADIHQLVLEWPHPSTENPAQVAYTQNDAKGVADIQTRTTIGKYLRRHFPAASDHHIRDVTALYTASQHSTCHFTPHTTEAIVRTVQTGPTSCMKYAVDDDDAPTDPADHPYAVYEPELGWSMAVRTRGAQIVARALVYTPHGGTPYFVRSFKAANEDDVAAGGYSHADEALERWLAEQGISKRDGWAGAVIAKIDSDKPRYDYLLPYLDGDDTYVVHTNNHPGHPGRSLFRITDDRAGYKCENNDGGHDPAGHDEDEDSRECDDCGDIEHEEDMTYVEYSDRCVCERCLSRSYTYVAEESTHVPAEEVTTAMDGTQWSDRRGAPGDYVELCDDSYHDREYAHIDDAVCDIHGDWWHDTDIARGSVVLLCDDSLNAGGYAPADDCTEHECGWLRDDVDTVPETATEATD